MNKLFLILLACFSLGTQASENILAGNLTSVRSDTLGNLMTLWGESFNRQYPGVNVQVQAAFPSPLRTLWLQGPLKLVP